MSEDDVCVACHKQLTCDGLLMTCASCHHGYHLGQACSGIAHSTFSAMGLAKREAWVCKTCRSAKARTGDGTQFVSQSLPREAAENPETPVANIGLAAELKAIKDSLLCLPVLTQKVDALLSLRDEFSNLATSVSNLEKSVNFMSDQYDSISTQLKDCKSQNVKLESEIVDLTTTVQEQTEQLQLLRNAQNDSEQYCRNANLEIHGLPLDKKENLKQTLEQLAVKLEIPNFSLNEIDAVHRLQGRRGSIPTVLVRFASVACKEKWFDARDNLRELHQAGKLPRLFFNENLTKQNRDLFWQARTAAKAKGYQFAWVKSGKIFVKKDESSARIRIGSLADLDKIV